MKISNLKIMKKYKKQFERDFNFYFAQKDKFTFAGSDIKSYYNIQFPEDIIEKQISQDLEIPVFVDIVYKFPYSLAGKSAKECFYDLDSSGKNNICSEPKLFVELLICKAAINLQIKSWAESRAEYTLSLNELEEYIDFYKAPDWVFLAVENQKTKILKNTMKNYNNHKFNLDTATLHISELIKEESNEK